MASRELWAALHLLDRQLVDRNGRMCGMVDDIELTRSEDTGDLYVSSLLAGPGVLATRLRARTMGRWLRRANTLLSHTDGDPAKVPLRSVADIGNLISLSVEAEEIGTAALERWVRRHVIAHIPGSRHEPE